MEQILKNQNTYMNNNMKNKMFDISCTPHGNSPVHINILEVLCGQPINLFQVASTSKLLENQQNDLVFFKIIPSHFCRVSEASKIDCFKN